MAVYLTKKQQDRKSAKGDKYLPHACARCGCGIRVTPGRTAGGSRHGDTGKARKVCDALLAARILEQGEEAEEDESEEDSEDRSAEQSEAEGSEEGEAFRCRSAQAAAAEAERGKLELEASLQYVLSVHDCPTTPTTPTTSPSPVTPSTSAAGHKHCVHFACVPVQVGAGGRGRS